MTRSFGPWSARAPPSQLGTPALILDVELPDGGQVTTAVPPEFQGFAYLLDGEGDVRSQPAPSDSRRSSSCLGPGETFAVTDAAPGTRFLLMTGKPYGEIPIFNGPYVD